jgi:hypothetical protein
LYFNPEIDPRLPPLPSTPHNYIRRKHSQGWLAWAAGQVQHSLGRA